MLDKPLEGLQQKLVADELVQLLPELFEENMKAINHIGNTLGGFVRSGSLSAVEVCSLVLLTFEGLHARMGWRSVGKPALA